MSFLSEAFLFAQNISHVPTVSNGILVAVNFSSLADIVAYLKSGHEETHGFLYVYFFL